MTTHLTEAELSELKHLLFWEATIGPWQVLEQINPSNGEAEKRFPNETVSPSIERTIATLYDHPQLKRPAQIISLATSPFKERAHFLHMREADAKLIVAAVNALPSLISALEAARQEAVGARAKALEEALDVCERILKDGLVTFVDGKSEIKTEGLMVSLTAQKIFNQIKELEAAAGTDKA